MLSWWPSSTSVTPPTLPPGPTQVGGKGDSPSPEYMEDSNVYTFFQRVLQCTLEKVHSEWCSKPLSEFGQKLIPGSRRAANYTLISLLDDRRRHGDHILGTMHTKRGFCLGWLNTDTFLEKCEGGVSRSRTKNYQHFVVANFFGIQKSTKNGEGLHMRV